MITNRKKLIIRYALFLKFPGMRNIEKNNRKTLFKDVTLNSFK